MKKQLFISLSIMMLFVSCSKQKKMNKNIEGKWNLTYVDGNLVSGYSQTIEFTRSDRANGDFKAITTPTGLASVTQNGEYYINEEAISIGFTYDNGETSAYEIVTAEDDLLVLKTSSPTDTTSYRFER